VNGNVVVAGGRSSNCEWWGSGCINYECCQNQRSSTSHVIPSEESKERETLRQDASSPEGRPFDEATRNVESLADPRNETAFGLVAKVNPTAVRNSRRNEEDARSIVVIVTRTTKRPPELLAPYATAQGNKPNDTNKFRTFHRDYMER
jgi:hypothetical protein